MRKLKKGAHTMWRRGGGSSAVLNRAEAVLMARTARTQVGGQGSFKTSSNPPHKQVSFCNLSDFSADSSADASGGQENSEQDLRPHSRFGRGSRFLKKAPPPTSSSRSPVNRTQKLLEPRSVPASQQNSQTQISAESRSSVQALEDTAHKTSGPSRTPPKLSIPKASATQQRPAQWGAGGSHFLKKKMGTGAAPTAALRSGWEVRSTSLQDLESKSGKAERGGSVDSDEEYMRELLGDSVDSSDSSLAEEGRHSPLKEPQKMLSSQRTHSIPSPPSSASHRRSPFRYSERGQNHFNPSVSSPSTPLPEKMGDFPKAESPQRLTSSLLECVEVLSLDELLPGGSVSSEAQSKSCKVSEDFPINIKNLDELIPASTSESGSQDQSKQSDPRSWREHQQLSQEDEEVQDYQSDFHSYSSATQVSEELSEEEEVLSEIRSDGANSEHSSLSEPYRHASQTSLASVRGPSKQWRISSSPRKPLKDAAVQTQPDHLTPDDASVPPAVARIYLSAPAGRGYALSAEQLEDISTYNPAVFVVNEVLKQQLAMTKEFVDSNRRLHANLMQSLEPPSYRYTTLQDTIQNIRRHRPAKLAMERHLEEVLQELGGFK